MRQIVLDTETTGLEVAQQHRIIEIGCVELRARRPTGQKFHRYLNPERDIDAGARAVHGLSRESLTDKPQFIEVADELLEFIDGSELIIHNAAFDLAFLDAEYARVPRHAALKVAERCKILDTLLMARELHPGQRNSLDALCKRYGIDNSHRDYHGALLDARILADVYLAMTGGQSALALDHAGGAAAGGAQRTARPPGLTLIVQKASDDEVAQHEEFVRLLDKQSQGKSLWRAC